MQIEKKNVSQLLPADYNPRKDLKPGDKEYEKLKRSIEQFGYVEPVIWNATTSRVVGGHQRLKVLIDMGITEVECVIVEMDEEKEKALNVALNKISGEWDNDKLALLIADLQGANFDVSLTGFEPEELEDLFREDTKKGVQDDDFDVDAELAKPTFSKAGDLWLLGDHRLVCGDSTKPEIYELLMNGKLANLVVTTLRTMSITKEAPVRLRTTIWKTVLSISSYWMPTLACTSQWQMTLLSMSFMQTPRALTSAEHLLMLVSTFLAAASGKSSPLSSDAAPTSGCMSLASSDGRNPASTSGIPDARKRPSGNLISPRRTATIRR
jgi:hypothetical protein